MNEGVRSHLSFIRYGRRKETKETRESSDTRETRPSTVTPLPKVARLHQADRQTKHMRHRTCPNMSKHSLLNIGKSCGHLVTCNLVCYLNYYLLLFLPVVSAQDGGASYVPVLVCSCQFMLQAPKDKLSANECAALLHRLCCSSFCSV